MFLIQVKFSCRRDKKIFLSEFIFLVFRKNIPIFSWFENKFLKSRKHFSVSFEGFAVRNMQRYGPIYETSQTGP